MYAILKLDEVPESCIDCPCDYDSILCQAIEDPDQKDFIVAQENGFDVWHMRLPACPLKIIREE